MKINLFAREKRSPQGIAIAIAANVLLVVAIGAITFRFPLSAFLGNHPPVPTPVHVNYVRVMPVAAPAPRAGTSEQSAPPTAKPPVVPVPDPVQAPTSVPVGIPAAPPANPSSGVVGVPGGTGTAATTAVSPLLGLQPGVPDVRLSTAAAIYATPKTMATRTDSAIKSAFNEYRDSVLAVQANPKRAPGDWTVDRNGQKWGWDPAGVHLGKFTIPNAIFAALPLKIGPTGYSINAITDNRLNAWTQKDLADHGRQMSDDDFRAALKRIRENADRRHDEEQRGTVIMGAPVKPPGGG